MDEREVIMKTIIKITVTKQGGGGEILKKEFDLPVLLVPGVELVDSAWHEPKKIIAVSVEPNEPYADVSLGMEHKAGEEFDRHIKMLKSHGWSQV